jgi:hypothetical protein
MCICCRFYLIHKRFKEEDNKEDDDKGDDETVINIDIPYKKNIVLY